MPQLHLLKLCVGADTVEDLLDWQAARRAEAPGRPLAHVTRMWPRREAELLDGGSLYWVFKGLVLARQPILGMEPREGADGVRRDKKRNGRDLSGRRWDEFPVAVVAA